MKDTMQSKWKGNLAFESMVGDHPVRTDAPVEFGGDNSGASPKRLMLASLAGCTGIDVASILKKMRVKIDELAITVEAEATEEIPAVYKAMHIIYTFKGEGLDERKLTKAVQLSHDKYCGVSKMYGRFLKISWEIQIAV
jgi:putative redox protein